MTLDCTTRMLAPFLDQLSDEELDVIAYGAVQLDAEGRVLSINRAEAEGLGYGQQRPVGSDYFSEIARSAFAAEVFGRYVEAFSSHQLDDTFRFTFTDGLMPRTVLMRMYYSARLGTVWIFTANPDGSPLLAVEDPERDGRDASAELAA
jgi:photoactive yellow protein